MREKAEVRDSGAAGRKHPSEHGRRYAERERPSAAREVVLLMRSRPSAYSAEKREAALRIEFSRLHRGSPRGRREGHP